MTAERGFVVLGELIACEGFKGGGCLGGACCHTNMGFSVLFEGESAFVGK